MRAFLAGDGADLGRRLRRLRERVIVNLAHRDLNNLASLDEVFATTTALAEECSAAALVEAETTTRDTFGPPGDEARLAVAAPGKLGGCELHGSSAARRGLP